MNDIDFSIMLVEDMTWEVLAVYDGKYNPIAKFDYYVNRTRGHISRMQEIVSELTNYIIDEESSTM